MTNTRQLDFKAMFDGYIADHQKVWDHDRASTVGASETFDCQRKVFFNKHEGDYTKDPVDPESGTDWGAMERGNHMEEWVVKILEHAIPESSEYLFGSEGQETFVYGKNSATPDGLITNLPSNALESLGIADIEGDCIMVEIKSFDPRANFDEEKAIHHGQAQVQMGIIRRMTEYRPMYAVVIYVNASFYDDIRVYPVRYEPSMWKAAVRRADEILSASTPEELRPEGKISGGCDYCHWQRECAKASKESVPSSDGGKNPLPEDDKLELYELVKRERELDRTKKEAETEQKEIREEIKELMKDLDRKKAKEPEFSVSWSWQEGRKSLDMAAAKEAGIDLEPFMKEGNGFDKMIIKLAGEKE